MPLPTTTEPGTTEAERLNVVRPDDVGTSAEDAPVEHDPHAPTHEGSTEEQVGDLTGPGAGYDKEPQQVKDAGGVS
jgi:hypothetical protein